MSDRDCGLSINDKEGRGADIVAATLAPLARGQSRKPSTLGQRLHLPLAVISDKAPESTSHLRDASKGA